MGSAPSEISEDAQINRDCAIAAGFAAGGVFETHRGRKGLGCPYYIAAAHMVSSGNADSYESGVRTFRAWSTMTNLPNILHAP
jgi:hypothetical protein